MISLFARKAQICFMISLIAFLGLGCGGGPWGPIETQKYKSGATWSPDGNNIILSMNTKLSRYGSTTGSFMNPYKDEDVKTSRSYIIKFNLQTKKTEILMEGKQEDYYDPRYGHPFWRDNKLFYIESRDLSMVDVNDISIKQTILKGVTYYQGEYSIQRNFTINRSGEYVIYWSDRYSSINDDWSVIEVSTSTDRVLITKNDITSSGEAYLLGWSNKGNTLIYRSSVNGSISDDRYFEVDMVGKITDIGTRCPQYDSMEDENISPDKTRIIYEQWREGYGLYVTDYVQGEDPVGGENISSYITNKSLGIEQ